MCFSLSLSKTIVTCIQQGSAHDHWSLSLRQVLVQIGVKNKKVGAYFPQAKLVHLMTNKWLMTNKATRKYSMFMHSVQTNIYSFCSPKRPSLTKKWSLHYVILGSVRLQRGQAVDTNHRNRANEYPLYLTMLNTGVSETTKEKRIAGLIQEMHTPLCKISVGREFLVIMCYNV